VLNHTIDDVAEIYDRYDYAEEKRAALKRLDDSLRRIARREHKVVAFNRRADACSKLTHRVSQSGPFADRYD
jgi:hypothetical protein